MEQYAATCPHCSFVLQFYDASLFGRKGRCPKCRNKFVLNQMDEAPAQVAAAPSIRSRPKPEKAGTLASTSPKKKRQAAPPAPSKPAARPKPAKSSSEQDEAWETDINRGLGVHNPTLPARWVLPNVLSVTSLLVIAIGASTGMGGVSLLLDDCPVYFLAAAAACGGLIATGFLVHRYNPQP